MLRFLATLLITALSLLTAPAQAQDQSRAILVLDASGSMWGQIDGVAKITIAQEVIGELLQSLPEDQLLGLTVYGARRKGDCSDIQTLLEPTSDRAAIAKLVNRVKPRGKTPMTDAVVAAAEALKYTEEKATVILISDGIETCNPDPCAAARIMEQNGVDFTAHVIGFNVSDQTALTQMKCLAEETGGLFRSASNADELAEALKEVAEPDPVEVTFRVTEGQGGPEITDGLIWTINTDTEGALYENEPNPPLTQTLLPGNGHVEVMRLADEAYAQADFPIAGDNLRITLVLPKMLPSATLDVPAQVVAGDTFPVQWSGPVDASSAITLSAPDAQVGAHMRYFYLDQQEGSSATMFAPVIPGTYEARYLTLLGNGADVLARKTIQVTPFDFAISAPDVAKVSSEVPVSWTIPAPGGFVISLAKAGDRPDASISHIYASSHENGAARFSMPAQPGAYEIRLQDGLSQATIVARQQIEVTDEIASLRGPDQVEIGARFDVMWNGPNKQVSGGGDYIATATPDMRPDQEVTFAYTKDSDGNIAELIAPVEPGTYEIRYILNGDGDRILARRMITVTPVGATLSFDSPAKAGTTLPVTWQGPGRHISGGGDYIAIAEPGMRPDQEVTYAYTKDSDGNVAPVEVPTIPGTYELRYVLNGPENVILASKELIVAPVAASLAFDSPASAGGTLAVTWDGPGGGDYIAIAEPGMRINDELTYAYVENSDGDVLKIDIPTTPGTYEVRYVQKGSELQVLASAPLEVAPVSASLSFESPAPAGGTLAVTWDGPGGADYIAIAEPGMRTNDEVTYAYVKNSVGDVLSLELPITPGTYEVRYIQKGDERKILARETVQVMPVSASVSYEGIAPAGGTLLVTWQGPGAESHNKTDYIAVALPGARANDTETYSYVNTGEGNVAQLPLPETPGTYELRYVQNGTQADKVLTSIPLDVVPLHATLEAPSSATPGAQVSVTWSGPAYLRDQIIIAKPGSVSAESFASPSAGSPVTLYAPTTQGSYEIRYVYAPLNQVLATIPLEVN